MRRAFWLLALVWGVVPLADAPAAAIDERVSFSEQLEVVRSKHHVPALGAAAMRGGELLEIAAMGWRRVGSPERVTTEDLWHIGSCAKSMTASLAAILVERGVIEWQTRIEDVFPEMRATMHPAWHTVTLDQLLTHRAGAPAQPPDDLRSEMQGEQSNATEQRRAFIKMLLERPPEFLPGRTFRYSDDGYAIAGAMLERQTRRSWEEMIRSELFIPLGMTSAGFGAPGRPDKVDQPWGHESIGDAVRPVAPGPLADNPPVIGPAGTVHCSLTDLVRYAAWHARAGRPPGPALLTAKSFEMLHAPARKNYALGWSVLNQSWAGGRVLMHPGSNAFWYAVMWVAPERDVAFVAVTNCCTSEAEDACEDAITLLVKRVIGEKR